MEAKSILQDLMFNSILLQYIQNIDIEKVKKIVYYIKNILIDYDSLKQLHMLTNYNGDRLLGYSLAFIHNETKSFFLHKIHVNTPYRNHNIGTEILKILQNENYQITLLCSEKNKSFFIKNGFHYIEPFKTSKYQDYKLSRNIYNGLLLMSNTKENNHNQVFLLKDNHINDIVNIARHNLS